MLDGWKAAATPHSLPLIIDEVKGRDLPRDWAERANLGPDDVVSVTIGADRRQLSANLKRAMDRIAAEAAAAGLTPEKLKEIIPDFPLELLRTPEVTTKSVRQFAA